MAHSNHLDVAHAQLLVVDMQQRMLPHVSGQKSVVSCAARMIQAALELELPITISEQYPQGLGPTDRRILEVAADAQRLEKLTFSAFAEPSCRERIMALMRPQVLLVGVETHVCVRQTALDMLDAQMRPFILADAVGSRRPRDREVALDELRAAGAVVTTVEAAIFGLMGQAGTELFKRILPIVR